MVPTGEFREQKLGTHNVHHHGLAQSENPSSAAVALDTMKKFSPFSGSSKNKRQIFQGMQSACDDFDNVQNLDEKFNNPSAQ